MTRLFVSSNLVSCTSHCGCGKLRADVAAYAQGPWSHLMVGTVEQTHIHDVMLCE